MKVKVHGLRAVPISGDYIRLDALLKYSSLASSGGQAKMIIKGGFVFVGSKVCTMRGKKVWPGDVVRYGDVALICLRCCPLKD